MANVFPSDWESCFFFKERKRKNLGKRKENSVSIAIVGPWQQSQPLFSSFMENLCKTLRNRSPCETIFSIIRHFECAHTHRDTLRALTRLPTCGSLLFCRFASKWWQLERAVEQNGASNAKMRILKSTFLRLQNNRHCKFGT